MVANSEVLKRRKEIRRRKRAIYVEDGASISYYRTAFGYPITRESFLGSRIGPLSGLLGNNQVSNPTKSDITTYVNEVIMSGQVLLDSNVPDMLIGSAYENPISPTNLVGDAAQAIIDATGKDGVQLESELVENTDIEYFLGVRVNDRHDANWSREDLVPIKQRFWDEGGLINNGGNSGFDFDYKPARDLMTEVIIEAINNENYKLKGVCLNFYRHYGYFKNVFYDNAESSIKTTQAQIDTMTTWVQGIHEAMNERSKALMAEGKDPLLLMIKVADSKEFNLLLGLDIDLWMQNGWVDIMVPYGYHEFNPVSYSLAWGKKYGVSVCPSFYDTRLKNTRVRKSRSGEAGRLIQLMSQSPDGFEVFNYNYDADPHFRGPSGIFWRVLSPAKLKSWQSSRVYYNCWTYQDGGAVGTSGTMPDTKYFPQISRTVNSNNPWRGDGNVHIYVYENPDEVNAVLRLYITRGDITAVNFNGTTLTKLVDGTYAIPSAALLMGKNTVSVSGTDILIDDIDVYVTSL